MSDRVQDPDRPGTVRPAAAGEPAARALALSVVIDGRFDTRRAGEVARLVTRLGLAGAWQRQPWWPELASDAPGAASPDDTARLLGDLAGGTGPAPAGLVVDTDSADPGLLDALLRAATGAGRLRMALAGRPGGVARWQHLVIEQNAVGLDQLALPAGQAGEATAGRSPGAPVPAGPVFVPFCPGRDLDTAVAGAAASAAGRPVLVEAAVSVGRTAAEAQARAEAEDLFALVGHPDREGLFGTLEECQAAAARLAHLGASELVCYLPRASDLPDVLAQLRAIAIGASVLRPGEPPSSPPPPPMGWGGRRVAP